MLIVKHRSSGFTLIELLVVILVIFSVGVLISSVLFSALRGANKTNTIDTVRRNGNSAITQMSRMIRYSQSFDGVSTDGTVYTTSCVSGVAASSPVISFPPPRLGFFSKFANLIQRFDNLGERGISGLFSKLANLIPKSGTPKTSLIPQVAAASSAGPNNPGLVVSDSSVSGIAWSSPSNAITSNNAYATADASSGCPCSVQYLKATNFGFGVPSDMTIAGVKVEAEIRESDGLVKDSSVRLVKNGSPVGSSRARSTEWPLSDSYVTWGSSIDLWGTTWTPADINSSSFGVVIRPLIEYSNSSGPDAYVDHIRITVFYSTAPTPSPTPTPTPTPTSVPTPTPTPTPTSVPTPTPTPIPTQYHYVRVTGFDGGQTTFHCDTSVIASNSASLIDTSSVDVSSCYFTCSQDNIFSPPNIGINFSLTQKGNPQFFENKDSVSFKTSVSVRNY